MRQKNSIEIILESIEAKVVMKEMGYVDTKSLRIEVERQRECFDKGNVLRTGGLGDLTEIEGGLPKHFDGYLWR